MHLSYPENQCYTLTLDLLMAFIVKWLMRFYPDYTLVLGVVLYVGYHCCDISRMDKLLDYLNVQPAKGTVFFLFPGKVYFCDNFVKNRVSE